MFWEKLTAVCAEKGVNPTDVMKRVYASPEMVEAWRNGGVPNLDKLKRIAKQLDIDVDQLIGDGIDDMSGNGEFWNGLVRACRANGTDPYKLAKKLTVSPDTVELWRRGGAPGSMLITRISRELNVPVAELYYYGESVGARDVHESVVLRHELESIAENLTDENVRKVIDYAEYIYAKQTYSIDIGND